MGKMRLQDVAPDAGERKSTTIKIIDLMSKRVISAEPHFTVARVRGLMQRNRILAVPVVGPEGEAVGMITATDLMDDLKDGTPISQIMTQRVYKAPAYNEVSVAARMMLKHRIHHLVVTNDQKVVGIISSFDLLRLVEDRRFELKNAARRGEAG
jgi:CBS domain-containing protein